MDDYTSDSDQVHEEQIQYTYLDGDNLPGGEIVLEGNENQNFEMIGIDIEEYERVRDQAEELDGRNWALKRKCIDYEQRLRISNRSVPARIKDKIRYWKKVATNITRRTKSWIKRLGRKSTEETRYHHTTQRYRDMLEARYYPHDLNLESEDESEGQEA